MPGCPGLCRGGSFTSFRTTEGVWLQLTGKFLPQWILLFDQSDFYFRHPKGFIADQTAQIIVRQDLGTKNLAHHY